MRISWHRLDSSPDLQDHPRKLDRYYAIAHEMFGKHFQRVVVIKLARQGVSMNKEMPLWSLLSNKLYLIVNVTHSYFQNSQDSWMQLYICLCVVIVSFYSILSPTFGWDPTRFEILFLLLRVLFMDFWILTAKSTGLKSKTQNQETQCTYVCGD